MVQREVRTVPFLKILKGLFKFVENPIPIVNEALEKYGDTYMSRIIGGRRIIMSIDPRVIQHVLQKNNKNYYKSELQTVALGRYIGKGLLTSNGPYWLRQRRLIQPGFHKEKLSALIKIMNGEIQAYCERLSHKIQDGQTEFDLPKEMTELTLRIVSRSLFSTGISDEKIEELGRNFTVLQKHIVREVRQPIFTFWRKLSGKRRRALNLATETKQIIVDIINDRKSDKQEYHDLLDMLINTRYADTGESMTDGQVLDEAIILFTAGHETTANALVWCLYLIESNMQECIPLFKEVDECGTDDITMDKLMGLEESKKVLSESMRLYPPAWILDRVALEDDEIDHVKIKKGDLIGLFVFGAHRNPLIWSEADKFIPDRFTKENTGLRPTYSYIPFGGGPRLCIGHHFAMMEMQMSLIHLLKKFSFVRKQKHEVELEPLITLRPKNGLNMHISRRDE